MYCVLAKSLRDFACAFKTGAFASGGRTTGAQASFIFRGCRQDWGRSNVKPMVTGLPSTMAAVTALPLALATTRVFPDDDGDGFSSRLIVGIDGRNAGLICCRSVTFGNRYYTPLAIQETPQGNLESLYPRIRTHSSRLRGLLLPLWG